LPLSCCMPVSVASFVQSKLTSSASTPRPASTACTLKKVPPDSPWSTLTPELLCEWPYTTRELPAASAVPVPTPSASPSSSRPSVPLTF
nr:hypothetical 9.2K protein - bovine adenovirus 3 [Bovine adenovirus 3]